MKISNCRFSFFDKNVSFIQDMSDCIHMQVFTATI